MSVALASNGRAYTKPSLRVVNDNQRLCRVFHLKISNWDEHRLVSWPVNAPDTSNDLSFVYDYSDQPTSVSGKASGSYRYDGHLKRVKAVVDNKTIYNVYNIAGELVHVHELTGDKKTDYVRLGGQTVARVRGVTGGSTSTNITYVYNDHLGSPVATKSGSAAIIRERYTPFGITTNNPADLDDQAGFTGHIKDKATGLNYMQARYYDTIIGRFLSVDPVTFLQTGNPSYFNRYRYCSNDPVNCTDPTGMSDAFGTTDQILFDTVKYAFAPVYDFLIADGVEAVNQVADGNLKAAIAPAAKATLKPVKVVSRIKESTKAVKAAKKAGNNQKVQADIDGLTKELGKGNMNPGTGTKSVGDGISEARGRNGGRVLFREKGSDGVEILGKSGKNPKNQQDAISAAKDIIKKERQ